jgi:probable rRNA maturation factor
MNQVRVTVLYQQHSKRLPSKIFLQTDIKRLALKILAILKKDNISLDIYLADNNIMKFLNQKFRGVDQPTEILSFQEPSNFPHPDDNLRYLGEIYLNMSQLKRGRFIVDDDNKKLLPVHFFTLERILAHGILHLFGFQHKKKYDRIKMEKLEEDIVAQL